MTTFAAIHSAGLSADVLSYAIHPDTDTLISLCALSSRATLEGLWANLSLQHPLTLSTAGHVQWPKIPMIPIRYQWPNSQIATILWIPHQASPLRIQRGQPAYLLMTDSSSHSHPPTFFAFLSTLLPCPLHADWTTALWNWGLEDGWITPLLTHNMVGWELNPLDDTCIEWIQRSLRDHTLPVPHTA